MTYQPYQRICFNIFFRVKLILIILLFSLRSSAESPEAAFLVNPCSFPDPVPSKLSIHTSFYPSNPVNDVRYSFEFIKRAKPPLVKILGGVAESDDAFSWAVKIKQVSPCTKVIGRIFIGNPESINTETGEKITELHPANRIFYAPPNNPDLSPEDQANIWFEVVKDKVKKYPDVDYWEGVNEPAFAPDKDVALKEMHWYARYEVKRMELLQELHTLACIANFSMGTPHVVDQGENTMWEAFYPALKKAQESSSILCLHEYGYPSMKKHFDENAQEGWFVGRYRKVMRHMEKVHPGLFKGENALKIAFTEAGIDGGRDKGWKSVLSPCAYLDELKWYDRLLKKDDNVIGATLFQFEIFPDPAWDSFDLKRVLNGLNALHHGIDPTSKETKYCAD